MAEVKWVKLLVDMFDNRKIKHLRRLPDGDSIVLLWVMLITLAGRCNENGMIFLTEDIPYDAKLLAAELDFEENTVELGLEAMKKLKMLEMRDGHLAIRGWAEHQNIEGMDKIREQNRLRQKAWYDRQKALTDASSETPNAKPNVRLTQPNAIEEEEEGDLEKEKEFHSINQAAQNAFFGENVEKSVENTRRSYLNGTLGKGVVLLSDEQFNDLMEKLSFDEFNKYIGIVAEQELAGKHYRKKTHYQAILDMAMEDRKTR